MGFDIGELAQQAGGGIVGGALGLALGSINDQRQISQQQKLTDMQVAAQEKLTEFNRSQQMAMWRDTGPQAMMEQYKAAGLNPALIYGGSGGGGQTANISTGNASGAQAPAGGKEAIETAGMGMQLATQQAQIKVLESQANLNNVEAQKKSGVDTANVQANTELTQQQIDNARQQFDSVKLDITMKNILNYEQQTSQQDRLLTIRANAQQAIEQSHIIAKQRNIIDSTLKDQITLIKQEAIGAALRNTAQRANTSLTEQQIKATANDILIKWDTLSNENQKTTLLRNQLQGIYKDTDQEYFNNLIKTIDAISIMKGKGIISTP